MSPFRFHGWFGKRLTASYDWRYDFDLGSLGRAAPIPGWPPPLRERSAVFARLAPNELERSLVIRHDPGAGIGWHRDRPVFEHVIGVSLGAPTALRFRRRNLGGFDRASALLALQSIYHLAGEARHKWEHSITKMQVVLLVDHLSQPVEESLIGIGNPLVIRWLIGWDTALASHCNHLC